MKRDHVIAESDWQAGKELLARIVAMLTRMMGPPEHVREPVDLPRFDGQPQ